LANTIDLEATLIRAEALFRRFQRTVQAIDKKQNFPAPKLRQRQTQNASSLQPTEEVDTSGTSTGADAGSANTNSPDTKGKRKPAEEDSQTRTKVISPELRKLLSRKVEVLPRKVVKKKGEGFDSKK
jgi:DNA-nicking Smr family endonuclease